MSNQIHRLPDTYDPVAIARILHRIQRGIGQIGAQQSDGGATTVVGGTTVNVEGSEIPDPLVVKIVRGTRDVLIGNISARVYDIAGYRPGNLTDDEVFVRHVLGRHFAGESIRIDVGGNPSTGMEATIRVNFGTAYYDFVVDDAGAITPEVPYLVGAAVEQNTVISAQIVGSANGISDITITISGYWLLLGP